MGREQTGKGKGGEAVQGDGREGGVARPHQSYFDHWSSDHISTDHTDSTDVNMLRHFGVGTTTFTIDCLPS